MKRKTRVIVLMGGKSPEHEVSLISGREVVGHLNPKKYEVFPVVISKDGQKWQLKNIEEFLMMKADVVFIAMHGQFGEDGTIQGLLELTGVPYTGAGVLASALGMDKPIFRNLIKNNDIKTPDFLVLNNNRIDEIWKRFSLPVVVKPASLGSSVGVSIVHSKSELKEAVDNAFKFDKRIMVEEFISGIEISCGVLGNENPVALPVIEIIPKTEFFDYEAKYVSGKCEEVVPARISDQLTKKVQEIAVKVFKAIGCRGFGRVDMIINNGEPYVLEINTIPGLTPNSLLPKEAAQAKISYPDLLDLLIKLALEK